VAKAEQRGLQAVGCLFFSGLQNQIRMALNGQYEKIDGNRNAGE
jgi:hypothetical protein